MLKKVLWEALLGILLAAVGLFVAERLFESQLVPSESLSEAIMGFGVMVVLLVLATIFQSELNLCVLWPSWRVWGFRLEVEGHVKLVRRLKFDLPGFVALLVWGIGAVAYTSHRLADTKYWYLAVVAHSAELGFAVVFARWWRGQAERLGFEITAIERGRRRAEADATAQATTGEPPARA